MRRTDLPEIEDQPWCPAWLRDAMTGYLSVVIEQARPYDVAIPVLSELLERTSSASIVDLASGASGPWPSLFASLEARHPSLRVTLTDINPNTAAISDVRSHRGIDYVERSVPADEVPAELVGVRTMFTALHHFSPARVRSIMSSAQRDRVGFVAYEATHRSVRGILVTLLIPILVLVMMPRVVPRRILPLILTYVPPLLPLLIWWDGFASTLRTHSVEELRELAAEIAEPGYTWRVDEVKVPGAPIPVLQLVGEPARHAA